MLFSNATRCTQLLKNPSRRVFQAVTPQLPAAATLCSAPRLSSFFHTKSPSQAPQLSTAYSPLTPFPFPVGNPTSSYGYRPGPLSKEDVDNFHRDGYIIKRKYYDDEEMKLLLTVAKNDRDLDTHAIDVPDGSGKKSKLSVWNEVGEDDIYSMVARGDRMVGAMEQLLGDEVYHYHSKMMLKEPKVGGAWEWHQDYGYWYKNGVLYPRLASGLIAVDKATKANGCLQVLKGSHHLGRIEHGVAGGQTGASMDYVEAAMQRMELVYIECQPGDILFFHCNTLHCSAPNTSDYPRWSLICCYNAKSNDPFRKSHHPNYSPLQKVPDSAIKQWGSDNVRNGKVIVKEENNNKVDKRKASFLDPDEDESTPGSTRAQPTSEVV